MSESAAFQPSAIAAAGVSPGIVLSAARRAQNISIEDVARQLRLSVQQVQAIEADAHDKLPAPVFVRGFIRNYARMLRIDSATLLQDFSSPSAAPDKPVAVALTGGVPFPEPRKHRRLPYFAIAALMLVAGLAWYEFYGSPKPEGAREAASSPAVVTTDLDAPVVTAVAGNPLTVAPQSVAPGEASPSTRSAAVLEFAFTVPSWVEVRDASGVSLVSETQAAGAKRVVSGVPPFSLVIGNAQGVSLTYNDKPVDLAPHMVNTVARMKLE